MTTSLDLGDVQGIVLRGYTMLALRQFLLRVDDAAGARSLLATLVDGDPATPQITVATPWTTKPDHCLNLFVTFAGLRALGVPESSLASFPEDFREGAAARAERVGDTGDMAPEHWLAPFAAGEVHLLLTLYGDTPEVVDRVGDQLRACFTGCTVVLVQDGAAMPGYKGHFGYTDGFSQPTIAGAPPTGFKDPLPEAPLGAFLLGYESQFDDHSYDVPVPEALGRNGSFMAYRVLEQDCHGFEVFLQETGAALGRDPEWVAAKIVGRWRNGVPLAMSPDTDVPDPPIDLVAMNDFDYLDDTKGVRCPIGSHARRMNPRSSRVAGGGGTEHRLVRRGLPYGPVYDPATPDDGIERGLLGMFLCVSLEDQFEFVMAEWIDDGTFAPGLGRTKDVILGNHTSAESEFKIPVDGGKPLVLSGFDRFVKTRAGAYFFLPSITAIRHLTGV